MVGNRIKYNEQSAQRRLRRNGMDVSELGLIVLKKDQHVGIVLWGTIDYLVNFHSYLCIRKQK